MGHPVLIDANNVVRRAIAVSAMDDFKAGGIYTGGVYGALNSISAFLRHYDGAGAPGPLFAFFDGGVPAFRKKLIPSYKVAREERKKMLPEEEYKKARSQMATAREALAMLGVHCISYKDREADDGVAAAVQWCVARRHRPVVVSSDRDLFQTVAMGARVWDIGHDRWVDQDTFVELLGVSADDYLLYKLLIGDSSDSIPGAGGCGEKRAAELLETYAPVLAEATTALAKLEGLRDALLALPEKKRRQFEQNIVAGFSRLCDSLGGIDLSASLGTAYVASLERAMRTPSTVCDTRAFMKFCARLQLMSVIRSPDRFVSPFLAAAKCRL
jgi:DNA polymerase-1